MYIKRHMECLLEQITAQYPVLLLTGSRQVGKTTMLEHLVQKEGRNRETVTKYSTHRNCFRISKCWWINAANRGISG